MPCLEMATHAVHFPQCNGLSKTSAGDAVPQQTLFLLLTCPDTESTLRQRTKHDPKSLDCLRLCHKTIHTLQHVFSCQPL